MIEHPRAFQYVLHVMDPDGLVGMSVGTLTRRGAIRKAEEWATARGLRVIDCGERYDPRTLTVNW